jgi:hypothetical protein
MKVKFSVAILLLLCLAAVAYADSDLVGTWMCEEEWDGVPVVDYFVFAADGTGEWSTDDGKVVETFAYSVDSDTVSLEWQESGEVTVYDYALNADGRLTLGIDFGYGEGYQEWVYDAVAKAAE